jgi:hypothetical protein
MVDDTPELSVFLFFSLSCGNLERKTRKSKLRMEESSAHQSHPTILNTTQHTNTTPEHITGLANESMVLRGDSFYKLPVFDRN